ncbi:MAG: M14 family zinc carboxypeptidase [Candidatus Eisenbacteria bacterium]
MAKPPYRRSWRSFYDRLLKDEKYGTTFDTKRYGPYHTYREIFIQIDRLLKRYPRHIFPVQIGTSVGGEPIWLFQAVNVSETSAEPVRFLVTSLIHSIEFIGAETNIHLLDRFTANMKQNPLLHEREVHFVPVLNPDGYLEVERDLARGRPRLRRRNGRGVDLNRNFSAFFSRRYFWHRALRRFYYPGHRPFSEPETAALRSHLQENRFDYALSLHSFGGRFLFPYGGTRRRSRHDEWYRNLGQTLIDHQPAYGYRAKQMGRQAPFFLTRGTESDYLHETYGTRAITVEILRAGPRLVNPRHLVDPFHLFNPKEPEKEIGNLTEPLLCFLSLNREGIFV